MGVLSKQLLRQRRWQLDDKWQQRGTRVWRVKATPDMDGDNVYQDFAQIGTAWSRGNPGLFVTSVASEDEARTADGNALWIVRAEYGHPADPAQNVHPHDRPPILTLGSDNFQETLYLSRAADMPICEHWDPAQVTPLQVDYDANDPTYDGTPGHINPWHYKTSIMDSAGCPFDPSIMDDWRDPVIVATRCEGIFPYDFAETFKDKLNSGNFTLVYRGWSHTWTKGQVWLSDLTSASEYEGNVYFERVSYTFRIRKDGWWRRVLDQGLMERNGDGALISIADRNGDPVQSQQLLDGHGKRLNDPQDSMPGRYPPKWLKWAWRPYANFGVMNLNVPWRAAQAMGSSSS